MTKVFALSILATLIFHVSSASQQPAETFPPLGKLINVSGHLMHINCVGEAGPTVVLEAGTSSFSFDWGLVQPEVAKFARVCSYDRAGHAWSELGPHPRTMKQNVFELHTLLQNAKVPGPYVLVGHSGGGYRVRLYQAQYPREVVGMVLSECGHENGIFILNGKPVRQRERATGRPIPEPRSDMTESDRTIPPHMLRLIEEQLRMRDLSRVNPPHDKLSPAIQRIRIWAQAQPKLSVSVYNPFEPEELAA